MDQDVKKYINKQKAPQREIIKKLHRIIVKTFPKIKDEMYVGVPWYEGMYYLVGLKDHVNLGFAIKGLKKKELEYFEGKGKMMRHLKFYTVKDINEKKVIKLLKLVKKNFKGKCH
jgi:hypothetical protein